MAEGSTARSTETHQGATHHPLSLLPTHSPIKSAVGDVDAPLQRLRDAWENAATDSQFTNSIV